MTATATYSDVAHRHVSLNQPRFEWLFSLAIYSLFAAMVFVVHGSEPSLSIDHVAYLWLADDILRLHPDGTSPLKVLQTT